MGNYTGFAGQAITGLAAVIAASGTKTPAIELKGFGLAQIALPATFTGTTLTFETCDTLAGTYNPLYGKDGNLVSMTVAQGRTYTIDPANFMGVGFLKIVSGSTEGSARTLTVSLRG